MACAAPTCHKTRGRKLKNKAPIPSRCIKPNTWIMYRGYMAGLGMTREEISSGYLEVKQEWLQDNPGRSRTERADWMNEKLCEEIAKSKSTGSVNARKKKAEKMKKEAAKKKKQEEDAKKKRKKEAERKKREKEAEEKEKEKEARQMTEQAEERKRQRKVRFKERRRQKKSRTKEKKTGTAKSKKKGRQRASSGGQNATFFAQRDVPAGWSTTRAVEEMHYPYEIKSRGADKQYRTIRFTKEDGGLREDDLMTLLPGEWYSDDVIGQYMDLLQNSPRKLPNSVFLPTYFYDDLMSKLLNRPKFSERHRLVAAWTADIDTTHPNATIYIPLNVGRRHWILLVVDNKKKKVFSLDSFGLERPGQRKNMLKWVEHEHMSKNVAFDRGKWSSESMEVPSQENNFDCGPFVCLFAALLSHGQALNFTQADLPRLRERLNWSLLNSKL